MRAYTIAQGPRLTETTSKAKTLGNGDLPESYPLPKESIQGKNIPRALGKRASQNSFPPRGGIQGKDLPGKDILPWQGT